MTPLIPRAFLERRAHSLSGLCITLFLIEHLLTNSQSAFINQDGGEGFIKAVDFIKSLPYLPLIEITLLAIPIGLHVLLGIRYLLEAKYNLLRSDGSAPSFPLYPGNRAYTWQRFTAIFLLVALLFHVVQMRFLEYPTELKKENHSFFLIPVSPDEKLPSLIKTLHSTLYSQTEIIQLIKQAPPTEKKAFERALTKMKINETIAVCPSFGTAELLLVRETFKDPILVILYACFVLAACFHGFNGLWTFLITWGVTLTPNSQSLTRKGVTFLMIATILLGFLAIFGTYFSTHVFYGK